ncbi:hypothetical protein GQX74_001433 [Glossina fuscipes]|nr:hypothetical protein GQX74_001433 [Glossina fuscipes]
MAQCSVKAQLTISRNLVYYPALGAIYSNVHFPIILKNTLLWLFLTLCNSTEALRFEAILVDPPPPPVDDAVRVDCLGNLFFHFMFVVFENTVIFEIFKFDFLLLGQC